MVSFLALILWIAIGIVVSKILGFYTKSTINRYGGSFLATVLLFGFAAGTHSYYKEHKKEQASPSQTSTKQEREARIAAYNQKSPCERALASYDPKRWHYTQSPDAHISKWRTVDCSTDNCSGYTGVKKGRVLERSIGRAYFFYKTDEPKDNYSTNVHHFTCKFDRPRVDLTFLNRDINRVLTHIGVPEISGQLKIHLSFDRKRTYKYNTENGYYIYIDIEDSWDKDCSYITHITHGHYEYK